MIKRTKLTFKSEKKTSVIPVHKSTSFPPEELSNATINEPLKGKFIYFLI